MKAPHDRWLIDSRRRVTHMFPIRAGRLRVIGVCAFALCVLGLAAAQGTQNEETTRKLWDTAFNTSRRKPARPGRNAARGNYRVATPRVTTEGVHGDSVVGVTV